MKIMHFVSGLSRGGVEKVVLNYTSKLNSNYHINEIIVYQHHSISNVLDLFESAGNKCIKIPSKKKHPIKNLWKTYKLIRKEKPDIVHAHMSLVNFFPLVIAKILRIKVRISHSHIAQDNIKLKFLVPLFKWLNIHTATHLLACGEKAGKYMYGNHNFKIIYNAIDLESFKFNAIKRRKIREYLKIDSKTKVFGHIGRLVKQKNQKFLIDLFNDYQNINNHNGKLILIGDGPLRNTIYQYARKSIWSSDIILIPGVDNPSDYYNCFDLFLLPSLYEGLPLVAIEAQASGLKALLSNTIDYSTKFRQTTNFLSIDNGTKIWIDNMYVEDNNSRNTINNNVNYNINLAYRNLYDYYICALKKEVLNG
ncbi:hypothetical protein DS831_08405 [Bombilactobacillus bombi]|uniref:Glycosyltransferase family 1 protein n=1 Tax=Bombilactobacillus bombi TaxID=1303590 RepID=A0A417ZFY3_9LACO|nr:glycosyltransferase [Bombilactobacillus bombi]RHW50167.1 hypothetical protein DS831_08405 [Bombilactobacillus bombi]